MAWLRLPSRGEKFLSPTHPLTAKLARPGPRLGQNRKPPSSKWASAQRRIAFVRECDRKRLPRAVSGPSVHTRVSDAPRVLSSSEALPTLCKPVTMTDNWASRQEDAMSVIDVQGQD